MKLHSRKVAELHQGLLESYKERLANIEDQEKDEKEEPFERSFLHNAIYLHNLWFEQLEEDISKDAEESPLLLEILDRRDSDLRTFIEWMSIFAKAAQPNGWAIWGWSSPLKTFVGFPIKSHDDKVPLGVEPILVIDCWEHAYIGDFENNFDEYLDKFWREINWKKIEERHHSLATLLGYNIK